jgi:hypothetical protein
VSIQFAEIVSKIISIIIIMGFLNYVMIDEWGLLNPNIGTGFRYWIVIRILLVGRIGLWSLETLRIFTTKLPPELVCVRT